MDKLQVRDICNISGVLNSGISRRIKSLIDESEILRNGQNRPLLSPEQIKLILKQEIVVNPTGKGKVAMIGNCKGGVGKSSLTYMLSQSISSLGLKVCVLDTDVQANLTSQYIEPDDFKYVFCDLINERSRDIDEIITKINPTLHIIPSSLKNSLIEKRLNVVASTVNYQKWFNRLCLDYLRENYDYVLIDTPPSLTRLNQIIGLNLLKTDFLIIPAIADRYSLDGISLFLSEIDEIRSSWEIEVDDYPKILIKLNKCLDNQNSHKQYKKEIKMAFKGMVSPYGFNDSAKIREIVSNKHPLSNMREIQKDIGIFLRELGILNKPRSRKNILEKGAKL